MRKSMQSMKRTIICLMVLIMMIIFTGTVFAQKGLVETVAEGCKKEIETYCSKVTFGEGRILACLYAHNDKLSGRCEYALYDAAAQLERAIAALTYVANECKDDLKAHCSSVKPGEGRLLNCLEKHEKDVSDRCKQAFKDVSLK
jgi:hypothetical protein